MFPAATIRDNALTDSGFNFTGGMRLEPEFVALLLGLVIGAAGLGSTIGITLGSVLRNVRPDVTVVVALVVDAAVTTLAAALYGLPTAVLLGLTAGLGLLGSGMIAAVQDNWLIEASPATPDVLIIAALFVAAVGVGVVGLRRGAPDAIPYVPAYLAEMAERERLTHELDLAREVQQSFLPKQMPEVAGLDFAAACLAAEDVGGDYYDVVRLDERRVGLVIGDVSGKGIHAAFYMTLVKGFVQALWTITAEPSEVLRRLNRFFCANAP